LLEQPARTHGNKAVYARPHGVVGQLPPSALVHDGPLVHAAADQVDEHGDEGDDAEDAAGAEGLLLFVETAAGVGRAAFEEVGAVVYGGDEGYAGFCEGVGVAEEGDDGGLAARVLVFVFFILVLVVLVLVFVFGGLLLLRLVVVFVVVRVLYDFAGEVGGLVALGLYRGAEGAARVVEDELAAAEDRLCVLEAVGMC
jgi:hypothetical protein